MAQTLIARLLLVIGITAAAGPLTANGPAARARAVQPAATSGPCPAHVVAAHHLDLSSLDIGGVAAVSANDVWVVGGVDVSQFSPYLPLIEHYDGKAWCAVNSNNWQGGGLSAVTAVSARDVWAVGTEIRALEWAGLGCGTRTRHTPGGHQRARSGVGLLRQQRVGDDPSRGTCGALGRATLAGGALACAVAPGIRVSRGNGHALAHGYVDGGGGRLAPLGHALGRTAVAGDDAASVAGPSHLQPRLTGIVHHVGSICYRRHGDCRTEARRRVGSRIPRRREWRWYLPAGVPLGRHALARGLAATSGMISACWSRRIRARLTTTSV